MSHRTGNTVVICSAIGIVLLALQQTTHVLPGSQKTFTFDRERCYGVVRAGRNDCGTAKHACAGRAMRDAQSDEWLMLPAGTCEKIIGGTGKPPSA
jgi:uncharacterized membrane protein